MNVKSNVINFINKLSKFKLTAKLGEKRESVRDRNFFLFLLLLLSCCKLYKTRGNIVKSSMSKKYTLPKFLTSSRSNLTPFTVESSGHEHLPMILTLLAHFIGNS
jgi:hypothetical protein